MIRRREFIAGLSSASAWPLAAGAQQRERLRRIGLLLGGVENSKSVQTAIATIRDGLARLGWL
jgi:putative tryptophan/tyrosine transport system substrate-binding protein